MYQKKNTTEMFGFGSNDEKDTQIPTQAQSIVEGSGSVMVSEFKPVPDVDYLQVSIADLIFPFYLSNELNPIFTQKKKKEKSLVLFILASYKKPNQCFPRW